MNDWQPMNTVPKDGTPVLIAFHNIGIHRVFWFEDLWCIEDCKNEPIHLRGYRENYLLGWMPLPAMPGVE